MPDQPSILQPAIVQGEYQDVLQKLRALTADHEKTYRLELGQYILQRFFGGSPALYGSRDPNKEASFKHFLAIHAAELAELALAEHTLRRCVRVRICHDSLPPGVRERLGWSALLQIAALDDPNQRARVAHAAVTQAWPVAQVRQAVAQAGQHRLWDAEPSEPGLQLPEPKDPAPPQPGRLVTRTEKWQAEVGAWREEFARIDASKLSRPQVERVRAALAALREQLAEVEKGLAGDPTSAPFKVRS